MKRLMLFSALLIVNTLNAQEAEATKPADSGSKVETNLFTPNLLSKYGKKSSFHVESFSFQPLKLYDASHLGISLTASSEYGLCHKAYDDIFANSNKQVKELFNKNTFTPLDQRIVFNAGIFLLTTTFVNNWIDTYVNNSKGFFKKYTGI